MALLIWRTRIISKKTTFSGTQQDFTFADWGDEAAFEPGECGPAAADWNLFNEALAAWVGGSGGGDSYCFEYDPGSYW